MKSKKIVSSSLAILLSSALTAVATPPDIFLPITIVPTEAPEKSTPIISPVSKPTQPISMVVNINSDDIGMTTTLPLNKKLSVDLQGRIEGNTEYQWVPDLCWKDSGIYTEDSMLEMVVIQIKCIPIPNINISKMRFEKFDFLPRLLGSTILSFKLIKTVKDTNLNPYGQSEVLDSIHFNINVVPAEEADNQSSQ